VSRRAAVALLAAGLLHAACSGEESGPAAPPSALPALSCTSDPPAADAVALRCGAAPARDTRIIEVVIGVPTESTDIMALNFDVVFDAALLQFQEATALPGNLLNQDGAGVLLLAGLLQSESGEIDPGRLVVGISRSAAGGVQGVAGRDVIMTFRLQAVPGMPFEAAMPRFENAEAKDSGGSPIPTIVFHDQLLLSAR
jgi:hypothetical protein